MRTSTKFVLAALLALPVALSAQSFQPNLEARLIGKPLYLRGFWSADDLHFDGSGKLISPSETTAFTLSGMDVTKVQLHGDGLVIDGRRVGLELEQKDARARVPLQTDPMQPNSDEPIHIEIALAPGADYSKALDAIFADGLASLTPSLPPYWQVYASRNFLAPGDGLPMYPKKVEKAIDKPIRKGKDTILRPTLAHSVAPDYPQAARNLQYKASVVVSLVVGKEGNPTHLQLIRPAGLGLDEQAIAAVQHYTFNPGTQKGKPIPTDLNVIVVFGGAQPPL
ncbi:energy transducer TonB [Granulicella arctica]|uniref:TonB family protein n=1 Tax=Granulicella arctica TaxID=940613 RepID=A0A7Y9PEK6_9BACT|nr:energy transducer TonB [Granulicella arctica]NYF78254.1 TonB family protein [Granulicella arctica]